MKRALCVLLAILLISSAVINASAEEMTEYSDRFYSFRYPSSWKQGIAYDGTIILEIPGTASGVMTFAAVTDLWNYTGDPAEDAALTESMISDYTEEKARANGKNTVLNGEYELIEVGDMHGFRAFGTWLAFNCDLIMIQLTYDRHLVSFILIGDEAIAKEEELISSVVLTSVDDTFSGEGFMHWEGDLFAFDYPDYYIKLDYGLKDKSEVIMFVDPDDTNNLLMARTYPLDYEYFDAYAPVFASSLLPKSTGIDAEPEMIWCGDWNPAVIKGNVQAGPLAFYVTGSGQTVLAVLFTGTEAVGMPQEIMASMIIY